MELCAKFFRDLFGRLNCCKPNGLSECIVNDPAQLSKQTSARSSTSTVNSRKKRSRNRFLRLFRSKPKRFSNYRPTKRYKRNRSKEEDIYLEKNRNDDSVLIFQLNKKPKQKQNRLLTEGLSSQN